LFGVTADGAAAVVHIESPTIFVPFDTSPSPRSAETVERIELVPLTGEAPSRLLAQSNNFYGYGDLSSDGSTLAFVEQGNARFGLVVVDVASASRRTVYLVDSPGRILQPRISGDGAMIAFHERPTRRAPSIVRVMPTGGGDPATIARDVRDVRWIEASVRADGERRQLLAMVSDEGESTTPPHVLIVDPSDPTVSVRVTDPERRPSEVAGAHDGTVYFTWSRGADCGLGSFRPADARPSFVATPVCVSDTTLTTDGRVVGVARATREGDADASDAELVVVDAATGEVTVETINRLRERYPEVSRTGRVVFERITVSQFERLGQAAICYVDL
jgi:hypothetical protein